MMVPQGGGAAASSATLTTPAIVVVLVLLLGATLYLWQARFIRRKTAYAIMLLLSVTLVGVGAWIHMNPFGAV